jgi:hypothetical protein
MRKRASIGLLLVTCAGLAAYAVWAFHAGSAAGGGWASLVHAWPYLLAGVLTVGVVTALFVGVAFYSERRGFDERARTPPAGRDGGSGR